MAYEIGNKQITDELLKSSGRWIADTLDYIGTKLVEFHEQGACFGVVHDVKGERYSSLAVKTGLADDCVGICRSKRGEPIDIQGFIKAYK